MYDKLVMTRKIWKPLFCRKVYEAANKDASSDAVYLDFSKAFDKSLHQSLSKVRTLGIGGNRA